MTDAQYMRRCLQLAEMGRGRVSPNPLVGCVIVQNEKVIGEGYHQAYGEAHAEVNAINSVADHKILEESTLCVSLEPCSHFGKTPPCTDLIINKRIPKVVICNTDPNPLVQGQGIKKLRQAGVKVITGVEGEQGELVNRAFFKAMRRKMPYITLKWAQTANGFMGRVTPSKEDGRISNKFSNKLVHKLRAMNDGILVGSNTVVQDNPLLTNRLWPGNSPVRIVLGSNIDIQKYQLGSNPPETIVRPFGPNGDLTAVLHELAESGIHSILVEGGARVLESFIAQDLWDEMIVIESDITWDEGVKAPLPSLKPKRSEQIGNDKWTYYLNTK